jgi:serine/threonine-protein kinase HipA
VSTLPVYYETRQVGTIEVGLDGPSFVYEPTWLRTRGAFPLSILMPLSTRPVKPSVFLTWAANLLPEGSQLRAIGSTIGAAPDDIISILAEIGRDTAGAVSIGKPGSSDKAGWKPIKKATDLERIIDELPLKPFLAGEDGVSMSLAGVQTKLGVAIDSAGKICIPINGAPSTHIIKPDSTRLYGGVQNEALCLTLARLTGLNAPIVTTGKAGKRTYFLINRYDRLQQGERWRRLHQEDFCQALGKPPSAKYEANQTGIKGPALADMFALTRNAMSAPDILGLLDYAIFNIVACNTDAHAKNYSLMINGRGFTLAPIYDVMCADAWSGVTRNLAQTIAGKNRGDHLKRRHWERFAADCGLNANRLIQRVGELCDVTTAALSQAVAAVEAMPAGPHPMLDEFRKSIAKRAAALKTGLKDDTGAEKPARPSRKKASNTPAS